METETTPTGQQILMFSAARRLNMAEEEQRAYQFLTAHFMSVVATREFLELDAEDVTRLLSADTLGCHCCLSTACVCHRRYWSWNHVAASGGVPGGTTIWAKLSPQRSAQRRTDSVRHPDVERPLPFCYNCGAEGHNARYVLQSPPVAKVRPVDNMRRAKREEEVFEAAMRWLNHAPVERSPHSEKLMAAIRFNHMNLSELHHCLEYPGVAEIEPVKKNVLDAIYSWVASESGSKDIVKKNVRHYTPLQECSNVSITAGNDDLPSNSAIPTSPDPTSGTYTTSDRSVADKPAYRAGGAFLVPKDPVKSTASVNTLGASQGDDRDHMSASFAGPLFRGSNSSFLRGQSAGGSARNVASGLGDSSGSYIEEETQERRVIESRTEEVRTVRRIRRSRSKNQAPTGPPPLAIEDTVWHRTESGHRAVRPVGLLPIADREYSNSRSMISGPCRTVTESRQSVEERTEAENVSEHAMSTSYASSQYSFGEVASADRMKLIEGTTPVAEDASSVASARPSTVSLGEIGAFSDRADSAVKAVSSTSSMYSLSAEEQDLNALAPWKSTIIERSARKESSGFESRASDKGGSEKSFPAASAERIEICDYKTIYGKSQSEEKQASKGLETIDEATTLVSLNSEARVEQEERKQKAEPCTELMPIDQPMEMEDLLLCDVHMAAEVARRKSSGSVRGEKTEEGPEAEHKDKPVTTNDRETNILAGPPVVTVSGIQGKRVSKDSSSRATTDVVTTAAEREKTSSDLDHVQSKQRLHLGNLESTVAEETASLEEKKLPSKKAEQGAAEISKALALSTEVKVTDTGTRKVATADQPLSTAESLERPKADVLQDGETSGPALSLPELEKARDIEETTDDGYKLVFLPQKRQDVEHKSVSDDESREVPYLEVESPASTDSGNADITTGPGGNEFYRDSVLEETVTHRALSDQSEASEGEREIRARASDQKSELSENFERVSDTPLATENNDKGDLVEYHEKSMILSEIALDPVSKRSSSGSVSSVREEKRASDHSVAEEGTATEEYAEMTITTEKSEGSHLLNEKKRLSNAMPDFLYEASDIRPQTTTSSEQGPHPEEVTHVEKVVAAAEAGREKVLSYEALVPLSEPASKKDLVEKKSSAQVTSADRSRIPSFEGGFPAEEIYSGVFVGLGDVASEAFSRDYGNRGTEVPSSKASPSEMPLVPMENSGLQNTRLASVGEVPSNEALVLLGELSTDVIEKKSITEVTSAERSRIPSFDAMFPAEEMYKGVFAGLSEAAGEAFSPESSKSDVKAIGEGSYSNARTHSEKNEQPRVAVGAVDQKPTNVPSNNAVVPFEERSSEADFVRKKSIPEATSVDRSRTPSFEGAFPAESMYTGVFVGLSEVANEPFSQVSSRHSAKAVSEGSHSEARFLSGERIEKRKDTIGAVKGELKEMSSNEALISLDGSQRKLVERQSSTESTAGDRSRIPSFEDGFLEDKCEAAFSGFRDVANEAFSAVSGKPDASAAAQRAIEPVPPPSAAVVDITEQEKIDSGIETINKRQRCDSCWQCHVEKALLMSRKAMLTQSTESLSQNQKPSVKAVSDKDLQEGADKCDKNIALDRMIVASPSAELVEVATNAAGETQKTSEKALSAVKSGDLVVPDNLSQKSSSDNQATEHLPQISAMATDHLEVYSPVAEPAPLDNAYKTVEVFTYPEWVSRKLGEGKSSSVFSSDAEMQSGSSTVPTIGSSGFSPPPGDVRSDSGESMSAPAVLQSTDRTRTEATCTAEGSTSTVTAAPSVMCTVSLGATAATSGFFPATTVTLEMSSVGSDGKTRDVPPDWLEKSASNFVALTSSLTTEKLTSYSSSSHHGPTDTSSSQKASPPPVVTAAKSEASCQKTAESSRPRYVLHKTRISATTPTQSLELFEETVTRIVSSENATTTDDKAAESRLQQGVERQASSENTVNTVSLEKSKKRKTLLKKPTPNFGEEKSMKEYYSEVSPLKDHTTKDNSRLNRRSSTKPPLLQRTQISARGLSHSIELISEQSFIKDSNNASDTSYPRIQTHCPESTGHSSFLSRLPGLKDVLDISSVSEENEKDISATSKVEVPRKMEKIGKKISDINFKRALLQDAFDSEKNPKRVDKIKMMVDRLNRTESALQRNLSTLAHKNASLYASGSKSEEVFSATNRDNTIRESEPIQNRFSLCSATEWKHFRLQ
ncbi:hypothetical protein HPB50_027924 [Hyalomma asiaticum]|nr:hypothetical protein HPB50_027924 [Hyalomma asiaticum]